MEYEANCIGYFNCEYFRMGEIIQRQNEIYHLMNALDENDTNTNRAKLNTLYNATEIIRVAIVNANPLGNEDPNT